ncbi:hypothetical protein HUW46_03767 [Amycolatopsis sp. CA-230715]|nr:hypothetical protein HUW46_03767 [Amycolatopsis sp. CA-230715]
MPLLLPLPPTGIGLRPQRMAGLASPEGETGHFAVFTGREGRYSDYAEFDLPNRVAHRTARTRVTRTPATTVAIAEAANRVG